MIWKCRPVSGNLSVSLICRTVIFLKRTFLSAGPATILAISEGSTTTTLLHRWKKAKEEFIFSIGSDDAVLPWALKVLDDVRRQYPQEEVIQWEQGFYAWLGLNGG